MAVDPERAPIFVVGTGRSGTTLLRMMLCAHPRIHLTHEASFYLWEARRTEALRDYLRRYLDGLSFRWLGLDPAPMLADLSADSPHRDFYAALMRTAASAHGKPRFGDKTPGHSDKLGRIFEDFPDARVIRIVRDPVGVIRSLVRMPWFPGSVIAGAVLVGQEERQCAEYRDRLHEVKLEALLDDPETVLRGVLEFVDEPWDPAVLDHTAHDPDDLPPLPWFQRATRKAERRAPRVPPDPAETRLLELLSGKARAQHGYPPAVLEAEPGFFAKAARYLRDLPGFVTGNVAFLWTLWWVASPGGTDDPRTLAWFRRINPGAWRAHPDFEMPSPPPLPEGWDTNLP
ncbi:MAG: sulfotransferase [Myxococcota bacterium]